LSSDDSSEGGRQSNGRPSKRQIILEDVLILLAIGVLFVLGVFFRREWWAQATLGVVLLAMLAIFIVRSRRVYRAFRERDDPGP